MQSHDQEARLAHVIADFKTARPPVGIDLARLYEENLIDGVVYHRHELDHNLSLRESRRLASQWPHATLDIQPASRAASVLYQATEFPSDAFTP